MYVYRDCALWRGSCRSGRCLSVSVSYTHLDVYKRQVHTVLIGDRKKETDQCKKQLEILFAYGCPVLEVIPENTAYDVIVDAIRCV